VNAQAPDALRHPSLNYCGVCLLRRWGSHYVAQAGLKLLGTSNRLASASRKLRLQAHTIMPSSTLVFFPPHLNT
jgi:hypothetical protein